MKDLTEDLGSPNLKYDDPAVQYSSTENASSSYKDRSQLSIFDKPASINNLSFKSGQVSKDKDQFLENQVSLVATTVQVSVV